MGFSQKMDSEDGEDVFEEYARHFRRTEARLSLV